MTEEVKNEINQVKLEKQSVAEAKAGCKKFKEIMDLAVRATKDLADKAIQDGNSLEEFRESY